MPAQPRTLPPQKLTTGEDVPQPAGLSESNFISCTHLLQHKSRPLQKLMWNTRKWFFTTHVSGNSSPHRMWRVPKAYKTLGETETFSRLLNTEKCLAREVSELETGRVLRGNAPEYILGFNLKLSLKHHLQKQEDSYPQLCPSSHGKSSAARVQLWGFCPSCHSHSCIAQVIVSSFLSSLDSVNFNSKLINLLMWKASWKRDC